MNIKKVYNNFKHNIRKIFGGELSRNFSEKDKKAELKTNSSERLELLEQSMLDVVWVLDSRNLTFLYISPSIEKLCGFESNTLVNKPFYFLSPFSKEQFERNVAERLALMDKTGAESSTYFEELEFIDNKGTIIHVETSTRYRFNKKNGNVEIVGVSRDINELKEHMHSLEQSENNIRLIIENLPHAVFAHNMKGEFVLVNKLSSSYTGYSNEELLAMRVADIDNTFTEEDSTAFWHMLHAEGFKQFQTTHKRKDGSIYPVEVTATAYLINNQYVILGIAEDITERKNVENKLIESEEKYRKIIETTTTGFMIVNSAGKIIDANPTICKLTGYSKDELLNLHIKDVEAIDSEQEIAIHIEKIIKQGYDRFESVFKRKDSTIFPVEVNTSFSTYKGGAFVSFITDIEDRKKTELSLKKSEKQLLELNAAKDKLFSVLAHDLKSPFMSILGFSELLVNNAQSYDREKIVRFAEIIQNMSARTYNLLEELLLWAKIQSGKLPFEPQNVSLQEICTEIIETLKQNAELKQIKIDCSIMETKVLADKNMLKTVLRNLISNAIKFTNPDGKIAVTNQFSNGSVIVSVSDTGIGITESDQKRLWSIAENFTTEGTASEKGSGFGLILCKEFVEKHGGKIWVESQIGEGSQFKFTLSVLK